MVLSRWVMSGEEMKLVEYYIINGLKIYYVTQKMYTEGGCSCNSIFKLVFLHQVISFHAV
jgi:hypothetical protein